MVKQYKDQQLVFISTDSFKNQIFTDSNVANCSHTIALSKQLKHVHNTLFNKLKIVSLYISFTIILQTKSNHWVIILEPNHTTYIHNLTFGNDKTVINKLNFKVKPNRYMEIKHLLNKILCIAIFI